MIINLTVFVLKNVSHCPQNNVSKQSKTDYDTVSADYNDFTQSLLLTIIVISETRFLMKEIS